MEELVKLEKARASARGWLTRSSRALRALVGSETVSRIELEDGIDEFNLRLSKLDDAQEAVEVLLDEKQIEADIDYADSFRRGVRVHLIEAAKRLSSVIKADVNPELISNVDSGSSARVKLPSLELPKFNGELTEWQSFWDRFLALVDETELPVISKFSYLQSLLVGDARSVINGLALTTSNYEVACTMLKERFGRRDRIIFAHIQALLNVTLTSKTPGSKYVSSLWKLQDELLTHIRSLKALDVSGEQFGLFLTPVILSRLPQDIRMEWSRDGSGKESDLDWLLTFLQKEIERRERSESFSDLSNVKVDTRCNTDSEKRKVSSASALQTSSAVLSCAFCGKAHRSDRCWNIQKLSLCDREDTIRAKGLCFKCLGSGHISRECFEKCSKCRGHHNVLCCRKVGRNSSRPDKTVPRLSNDVQIRPKQISIEEPVTNIACNLSDVNHVGVAPTVMPPRCTVLQTATVKVYGEGGVTEATLLFDTGSDRSYVSSKLVRKIKPKWVSSEPISYSSFGGKSPTSNQSNVFDLTLMDRDGKSQSLLAMEIPTICCPLIRPQVPTKLLNLFGPIEFADAYEQNRHVTVDILVGLDFYWKFMLPGRTCHIDQLVAQESQFGWVLSGTWNAQSSASASTTTPQLLCLDLIPDSVFRSFWELESVGINERESMADPVMESFEETVAVVENRYQVALPWKSEKAKNSLISNEGIARKRLESLSRKLDRDPTLKVQYNAVFRDYENEGIIEEVPASEIDGSYPIYYLPHRPVVRETSVSTKVRPVFDASAASYNGISLNDCLDSGPSLIPNLVEILIRFRRWKVALTADVSKAFLQVGVRPEDQDVHRFLWKDLDSIRTMRFVRVPFGNKSSPFLLNATIKHHLASCPPSVVVDELNENLYVDDWLSGADSDREGCDRFNEAREILAQAKMVLAKWSSNSKVLTDKFNHEFGYQTESESIKILGLQWFSSIDCFSYHGFDMFPRETSLELVSTKRAVLSLMARLFDPLGFLSPYTMLAKIMFQDIWRLGLGWDDELPEGMRSKFLKWVMGVEVLKGWRIPRCYSSGVSWWVVTGVELHAFGDASEKGYGACVYLRIPQGGGTFEVSLVMAKAKVSPIKRVTIPRLELLGAMLCARLLVFVRSALRLPDTVVYRCWTDSQVALAWIKGDPHRWKTFVANRVTEIQTVTSPCCWYHCPGKENPADLITRGVFAEELVASSLWLHGPGWLSDSVSFTEGKLCSTVPVPEDEIVDEIKVSCVSLNQSTVVFELERFGRFTKVIHVAAWVLRFIHNARPKSQRMCRPFSLDELSTAKFKVFMCVQQSTYHAEIETLKACKQLPKGSSLLKLDPFVADDGLLRVRGRLQFSDLSYESKHPIILPFGHLTKLLVRFQHELLKHAGVTTLVSTLRNSYWIVGLRRLAKSVCRECVSCRRQDSRACDQPIAPLPGLRVKSAPPFTVTGLDFAGPLFCVDFPRKKFYILLFTCAVVRSVHLELTDSMNLSDCLLAIRRFTARRGMPSVFYSDNAKTFIAASRKIQQYFDHLAPNWKFIVPRSPWWGGWWERLVRSVKSALRKTLGVRCLSRSELETTLHEIEACVNSRPLTFVSDEFDASQPLTPSHFLMGRPAGFQPELIDDQTICVSTKDLTAREVVRQQMLDKFWRIWSDDYLRNLPPTGNSVFSKCELKTGSIVLIRENNVPRLAWPLGVVVDVFPGRDGLIRSVNVRTAKGVVCRSIQKLHDLEISGLD